MKGVKRIHVSKAFAKQLKKDAIDVDMPVTKYTEKMTKHLEEIKKKCKHGKN